MLSNGAIGFVLKNIKINELTEALKKIINGEQYISNELQFKLVKPLSKNEYVIEESTKLTICLTSREKEIIKLISSGLTNKQIAKELFISHKTVDNHRSNIMKKLDVHNIAELIKITISNHLI